MFTNSKGPELWTCVLVTVITLVVPAHAQNGVAAVQPTASVSILDSTRERDGLVGPVRRVRIQSARLELKAGHLLEGPLQLLEITTYGLSGNRIDNESYLVANSSVGKEEYKYNDKGNIVEMTLRGNDGSILSREKYEYEFDRFGNWRKMVTSLVLFENGELAHEPVEVTYRDIAYYFDDSVAKIVKPTSTPVVLPAATPIFPKSANAVGPEIRPDILTSSDRPLLIEIGGEPPDLPERARKETDTLRRSNPESNKAPVTNAEPAISPTPAKDVSAPATTGTVPVSKEATNRVSLGRKNAIAYYEKGREYFRLGALEEAVDSYQRSIEWEPRAAEVYLSLGHAYLRLENNKEAGKAFKQAILLNPELAEAHYGLGLHHFSAGRHKNAADAFKRATHLRPDMAKAHYGLALAYQEQGKLDEMVAEFRILETLDRGLAKKLADMVPEFNLPCRAPFCK